MTSRDHLAQNTELGIEASLLLTCIQKDHLLELRKMIGFMAATMSMQLNGSVVVDARHDENNRGPTRRSSPNEIAELNFGTWTIQRDGEVLGDLMYFGRTSSVKPHYYDIGIPRTLQQGEITNSELA